MYIFVEIYFDECHLIECLKSLANTHYATTGTNTNNTTTTTDTGDTNSTTANTDNTATIPNTADTTTMHSNGKCRKRIALLGTVQFVSILFKVQEKLVAEGMYDR